MSVYYCWSTLSLDVGDSLLFLRVPSHERPDCKTVKGWRERGTWSAGLTLGFDPVQLGSTGTPYRHTDPAQSSEPGQNRSTNTTEGPHFPQGSLVCIYWTSLNMQFTEMGIYFGTERLPVLHCINILIKPDWEDSCTIYQDGRCVSGKTSTGNIFMKNGL